MVGAILFGAVLVFQLVTLPTEINASRRAMKTLESMYLLEGDELTGARKTLTAAWIDMLRRLRQRHFNF